MLLDLVYLMVVAGAAPIVSACTEQAYTVCRFSLHCTPQWTGFKQEVPFTKTM